MGRLHRGQAKEEGRKVETAKFPWAASGAPSPTALDYGFTKLIFDAETIASSAAPSSARTPAT